MNALSREIERLIFRAEKGNVIAQSDLGMMYYNGRYQGYPVEQNYKKARRWCMLAAAQGDIDAQCHLGLMYELGYGVAQDFKLAGKWYRLAALAGDAVAQSHLALLLEAGALGPRPDYSQAAKWYRRAAEQGDENARRALAELNGKIKARRRLDAATALARENA